MRWLIGLVMLLASAGLSETVWAECKVLSTIPTYTAGQLKDLTCGTNGALSVGGGVGSATAVAPTFAEGSTGYFTWDLNGNVRVTFGTCFSGESACIATSANSYMMAVPGVVRLFTVMTGVTTNTTSATTAAVHSGGKTPMASLTGTGALTGTVTFYGDYENTTTGGEAICALVLDATTKGIKFCRQFTKDYPYYHAVTTNITGTSATVEASIAVGAAGTNDQRFLDSGIKAADALIKTGAGFLQCVWISQADAAPTAGTISVNDATSAGTGTPIFTWNLTTAVFTPFQICPQRPFTTGLYFDFTTTADVNVSGSYQ